MAVQIHKVYLLGDFQLEPDNHLLKRQGLPVSLNKKRFQVLVYMIEQRDRLVPRQQLLDEFWDGSEVYEENLTKCISEIRKALDDQKKPHKFIETVPAVGYRYIGPVSEKVSELEPSMFAAEKMRGVKIVVEEDDALNGEFVSEKALPVQRRAPGVRELRQEGSRRGSWLLPAILGGAIIIFAASAFVIHRSRIPSATSSTSAPIRSIAVLPFKNLSGEQAEEYFSDGMTESLITALSKIDDVKVISRGSVFSFKSKELDPREIGRQLNVEAVLEGSVRRDGSSVRVAARLVSTKDGRILWSNESYERKLEDIFNVQDEIARNVAAGLTRKLSEPGTRRLTKRYTENSEAYQLFMKGRYHLGLRKGADVEKAIGYFEQAIALDPKYALAYANLSIAYASRSDLGALPPTSTMPEVRAAALRAIEMDDSLADAHTSLANYEHTFAWNLPEAEKEFRRALELDPNSSDAHHYFSWYLLCLGRFDESIKEIKTAQELDPVSLYINKDVGMFLYFARRYDEAIEALQKTLDMDPTFATAEIYLSGCYEQQGKYDQAFEHAIKVGELQGLSPAAIAQMRAAYTSSGWKGYVRKRLEQHKELAKRQYVRPFGFASAYARLGEKDQALQWLEKACDEHEVYVTSLKVNPVWDSLRSDPRFTNLLRRIGLAT